MTCNSCGGAGIIRVARAPSQPENGPIVIRQKPVAINHTKASVAPRAFKGVRSARDVDVDKHRDHK